METWSAAECAAETGIDERTFRAYVSRRHPRGNPAPEPVGFDQQTGLRVWDAQRVRTWHAARSGPGARTDRDEAATGRLGWLGDHLAVVGAAIIAADTGLDAWIHFDCESGHLSVTRVEPDALTAAVIGHAATHSRAPSWIWTDADDKKPLFAPRFEPSLEILDQQMTARSGLRLLDQQMIAAISPRRNPLDMVPANRGSEIVAGRLRKLAPLVATMPPEQVHRELTTSGAKPTPGIDLRWGPPTTPVRAWCALWALTAFPPSRAMGITGGPDGDVRVPGHARRGSSKTGGVEWFALPARQSEITLAGWRSLATSQKVWDAAFSSPLRALIGEDHPLWPSRPDMVEGLMGRDRQGKAAAACSWLNGRGVPALIVWPIAEDRGMTTKRWALQGAVLPLAGLA